MRYEEISTNKGRKCVVHFGGDCTMYAYVYGYKHFYYFRADGLRSVKYSADDLRRLAPFVFTYLKQMAGIRSYKGV